VRPGAYYDDDDATNDDERATDDDSALRVVCEVIFPPLEVAIGAA
jgi:hypothetical protein